jgi:hypothetical protein
MTKDDQGLGDDPIRKASAEKLVWWPRISATTFQVAFVRPHSLLLEL